MRWIKSGVLPFLVVATSVLGCGNASDDGMWRGRIEVVAGTSRVISEAPILHSPDQTADVALEENLIIDGRGTQTFSSIFGITTDNAGNIYVADSEQKHILKFDLSLIHI